ncbi:hypothetical protein D3C76_246750 [compost metagenome]
MHRDEFPLLVGLCHLIPHPFQLLRELNIRFVRLDLPFVLGIDLHKQGITVFESIYRPVMSTRPDIFWKIKMVIEVIIRIILYLMVADNRCKWHIGKFFFRHTQEPLPQLLQITVIR